MKTKELKKYINNSVAILWYWKEGKSTLSFLLKLWFTDITIIDKNKNQEKTEWIKYNLWDNYLDNLWIYKLIFKSPWISPYHEKLREYKNKLITQTQLFLENYIWKIIWITWTKWKSTISTLTYELLKWLWYNVILVWNIGKPVLEEINILNNDIYDYVIYELSSYMLEWIKPKLYIWVLNNIYNCHLDWHRWRENYEKAKIWIIENSEYKLVNFELKEKVKNINGIILFWESWKYLYKNWLFYKNEQVILEDEKIALQWEHNKKNITSILWIIDIIDQNILENKLDNIKNTLSLFWWLPHRLENIWTYNWIIFIDDGIAVTPEATIAAIETYKQNIWTIILWGQDWIYNYEKLINTLKIYNINNIILFPDTWEKIFWDLSKFNYESEFILNWDFNPKIFKTKSMSSAVNFAYKNTEKWKICLLSNAAPSYNLWSWFIEKWLEFKNEVKIQSKNNKKRYKL
jgi:UDP-N-acetylmuramoylalanine--D-glutamate ligase